jgi:hypothetical protein
MTRLVIGPDCTYIRFAPFREERTADDRLSGSVGSPWREVVTISRRSALLLPWVSIQHSVFLIPMVRLASLANGSNRPGVGGSAAPRASTLVAGGPVQG